jgi:hypothetical protein
MPGLFTPRDNTVFKVVLALALASPVVALGGLMILARTSLGTEYKRQRTQPIEFDHRHHVGDDGIDCRYCHDEVEKSPYAGVPPTSRCLNCHAQIWNRSELLAPVRRAYFEDRSIPWVRVNRLPGYVYFNHAIHVNKGVGCVTCHGRVDLMPVPEQSTPLTMGWCLDCHRDPGPNLRPPDRITDMTWRPPKDALAAAELATRLLARYRVHTRTSCTTCHR